ncbi:MAG: SH3 domain-containing protein [Fimbriiglobus sp.]
MRTAVLLAAVTLAAAVTAGPGIAQTAPFLAEIDADSVTLRSGPGDQMPETGQLFRGGQVVVDHEEGEKWLAIQPPRGQVSWIKNVNLGPVDAQTTELIPRNAIVHAEPEAEIAFGRPGSGKPLDVRRTRVPDQTIVLVIGPKVEAGGTWWHPIEPPDGDFRYIPKSAVRFLKGQPVQSFVVRTPKIAPVADLPKTEAPMPIASIPSAGPVARPAPIRGDNWPNHPLWMQAEDAERRGDFGRAESLYLRLAGDMNRPGGDAELANLCYTRVHAIREKQRQVSRPAGGSPAVGGTGGDRRDGDARWAGPGVLREAGFKFEKRTTYALVNARGQVICYALPGQGVALDRFVRDDVQMYGTVDFPGDLRGAGVMTVSHVRAAGP